MKWEPAGFSIILIGLKIHIKNIVEHLTFYQSMFITIIFQDEKYCVLSFMSQLFKPNLQTCQICFIVSHVSGIRNWSNLWGKFLIFSHQRGLSTHVCLFFSHCRPNVPKHWMWHHKNLSRSQYFPSVILLAHWLSWICLHTNHA